MTLGTILLIIVILMLAGAFPRAGAYNGSWGYGPSGILGIVLVVVVVLLLMGRL